MIFYIYPLLWGEKLKFGCKIAFEESFKAGFAFERRYQDIHVQNGSHPLLIWCLIKKSLNSLQNVKTLRIWNESTNSGIILNCHLVIQPLLPQRGIFYGAWKIDPREFERRRQVWNNFCNNFKEFESNFGSKLSCTPESVKCGTAAGYIRMYKVEVNLILDSRFTSTSPSWWLWFKSEFWNIKHLFVHPY